MGAQKKKEATSPTASSTGGQTISSPASQKSSGLSSGETTNLLTPPYRVDTPFNFAESVNPELQQTVQQQDQARSNRLNQINQVYDASQGQGATTQSQKAQPNTGELKEVKLDKDMEGSRAGYVYNKFLNGIGELANSVADLSVGVMVNSPYKVDPNTGMPVFSGSEDMKGQKQILTDYRKNTAQTVRDYIKDNVGSTIDEGLERKYNNEFLTSAIGGLSNSLPSMLLPAPLRGAAMVLQGYDAGIRSLEANDPNGEIDDLTKTIYGASIGTATGLLEKYGFDRLLGANTTNVATALTNKALREATEAGGGKVTGDGLTKFLNSNISDFVEQYSKRGARALEGFAIEAGTGASQEVAGIASEYILNSATGKPVFDTEDATLEGLVNNLKRVAYAGAQEGVGGGLIRGIVNPKVKKQLEGEQQALENINDELENPNLSETTKEVLVQQKINLQTNIESIAEETRKAISKLSPKVQAEAENVNSQIDQLDAVIADPNVSDEVKTQIEAQKKPLEEELTNILTEVPTENVNASQETRTSVKKGGDVAIDDTVELVNGRTGKVIGVEGNQITMKMENGSTFMATPEMVEMSVVKPKVDTEYISEREDGTLKPLSERQNKPAVETKVPEIVETPIEVKETIVEPVIESNETPTEVVTKEVIPEAEVVPTETVQEALDAPVLKKAEDDLTALKQVTNKVQKYQASVKRLNEALKAGNITKQQFEETKQRFDDVITDSDVRVPKVTNLTPQETIELDNELKNENLTTNDFIQYERARAIEDVNNATEAVQQPEVDNGGGTTEVPTGEEAQRDFAVQEINKGAINWDGDRFSPRPDLGLEWSDIRKGQSDLLAGKSSPASKRLVEAIDKARKEGGYNFIQGSGKIVNRIFVPLEADYAETQLTESDLKNIKDNEDQLAREYDEWFSQLSDEDKQQEINFTEDGKQINETAESQADVSNQKDAIQSKTAQNKVRVIQDKRQSIKDRISQKLKDQRGQLNSGFDASLISDFVELGATYIEEGIVNASDFIKSFREDYKAMGFDDSQITDEDITNEILKPNQKQQTSDKFFKLAHKNIQSDEISNTLNNVERETGRELTQEEKEYKVTKRTEAVNYGYDVVEAAKEEYGDRYVTELLRFLDENARTLSIENKALITISLELDLERQLQENPTDITLNKQLKLVRDVSTRQQRSAAIATGYGILRQIARVGYDINQVTDQFFTNQQLEDRRKLAKAVESTPDDINKEADIQEGAINVSEDVKVTPKKRKPRLGLSEAQQTEKQALAKEFRGVFNDVTRIATLLADKKFMRYAKLVLLDTAGDFESFATSMIENVGEGIREHLPKIYQKIGGTDDIRPLTEAQKAKKSNIKDIVKKALIDKGYGREITVTLTERDADGNAVLTDKGIVNKVKEKREVIDWKKLAGEEGSVDNIRNNVEASLRESGYSDADISAIQTELVDEYNRLHASIIEKSIRELETRNKEREPIDAKTSARRLAELYNYGLFEEESDTYDNIVNNAIGLNKIGQEAFNDAKKLAKSLSDLYRSTDENGRRITEFGLKEAIRNINTQIEDLLSKVAWEQSNKAFKIATVVKEYMNFAQRAMLQTMKQILENPFSGSIQRLFTILGYMGEVDSKDLRVARRLASVRVYEDIVRNGGLTYGEITTPLVNKSKLEEKLNKVSDSKLYHTAISGLLGRAYLDGADSMHKTALTERYFVHNLVRILQKRGMTKQEAIDYVSAQLTGQRFNDALGTAKTIIDATNEKAGKKVLPDNPQAVFRLATNIVKDALVVGDNISLRELEASYEAAYKAAGYDLGHEANNLVSAMLGSSTTKVENAIKLAVKEKKWNEATALTFISILNKNILNPFVGGGTNWMVLTLQKAGVDIISPVRDYAKMKDNPLDITTQAGIKNIENSLLANLRFKNTANRVVIGLMASVLVASVAIASGADDDLNDWLKKNEWARKYFNVLSPQALVLLVSLENKEVGDYLAQLMGIKYDNYSDAKKLYQGLTGVIDDNSNKNRKGWAKLGEVVGGHTSFPGPWRVAKDLEKISRSVQGKPERKSESGGKGFASGYFRGGLIDYLGFRPMGKNGQPLNEQETQKAIDEALKELNKNKQ